MNDDAAFMMTLFICELLVLIPVLIFMVIVRWRLFEKAGQEGWKSIIPVYNTYVLTCDIAGKDTTTFILHLIPLVNIYAKVVTSISLAKSFGKDDGFGIGLWLLAIVFYPILAFNKSIEYIGPDGIPPNNEGPTKHWQDMPHEPDKT